MPLQQLAPAEIPDGMKLGGAAALPVCPSTVFVGILSLLFLHARTDLQALVCYTGGILADAVGGTTSRASYADHCCCRFHKSCKSHLAEQLLDGTDPDDDP